MTNGKSSRRAASLSALAALACAAGLSACNAAPEETVFLENVPVDSAVFWPPTLRYAYNGDTLTMQMRGVKRQRTCAHVLKLGWDFRRDSTGAEFYTANSAFEVPSGCAADPQGIDSIYKPRVFTLVGKRFYLVTPDGRLTDSVLFVSADRSKLPVMDTLLHVVSAGPASTQGRLSFLDSTASHPRRTVTADSLAACETLQAAVYDQRGDTLVVRVRRLFGSALPVSLFPPCEGIHADTIEVLANLYRFP